LNFDQSKKGLPRVKKIELKYGFEGFEERNDFLHRNFFRFEVDFERTFREASRFEFQYNLLEFLLGIFNFE
jgi:hypothetical protein